MEMIQLNMTTLTNCPAHPARMIAAKQGGFSALPRRPRSLGPLMAVYYAAKAYVLSFSEAIGNELKGTGVTVTALCPGLRTGFATAAGVTNTICSALPASWTHRGGGRLPRVYEREGRRHSGLLNKVLVWGIAQPPVDGDADLGGCRSGRWSSRRSMVDGR